jgi:hypothetical protein
MNVEVGSYIKFELYNDDANLFITSLLKITKEEGAMGFKSYGLTEDEIKTLSAIIENIG